MPVTTDDVKTLIPVSSPLIQVAGGNLYQINVETTAEQVKTADGMNVETRLTTLERAVSGMRVAHTVNTIAERDALVGKSVNAGDRVYVLDASADESVEKGAAVYLFMSDQSWLKIGEEESLDVICSWDHIEGKPDSTPAQIDMTVAARHTHDNIETLAHLSNDDAGNLLFKGKRINDGKVWVARVETLADIPANLADYGLVFVTGGTGGGDASGGGDAGDDSGETDNG